MDYEVNPPDYYALLLWNGFIDEFYYLLLLLFSGLNRFPNNYVFDDFCWVKGIMGNEKLCWELKGLNPPEDDYYEGFGGGRLKDYFFWN